MIGRREFGVASLSALALAALERSAVAQRDQEKQNAGSAHHEMLEKCAAACNACQRLCDMCTTHCARLIQQGHNDHAVTLATCQDCADFCVAAAQIVARGGPYAILICESCAEACAKCGEQCEKFPDDAMMKRCAAECRKCEKACREMVQHVAKAA